MNDISHSLICLNLQSSYYYQVFNSSSPWALVAWAQESKLCRSSDAPWCEHHLCDTLPNSDPLPSSNGKLLRLIPLLRGIDVACWETSTLLALSSSPSITLVDLWMRGSFIDRERITGSMTSLSSISSDEESEATSVIFPLDCVRDWLCEWVPTCPFQLGGAMLHLVNHRYHLQLGRYVLHIADSQSCLLLFTRWVHLTHNK